MTPAKHTLEQLASTTPGKTMEEKDKQLQASLFLSMYGAVQSILGRGVMPTPLFSLSYDQRNHRLDFERCEGQASIVRAERYSISAIDLIFACHARDIPLILEGDTGVGKTLTTETYLKTILPEESSVRMSLSHQSFTDSPKAVFERAKMDQGMPVTYINREALRKIAAMYIDELNLGNPNDLLQLSHGRVLLSTERGIAGIPIPKLTKDGIKYDEEEYLKRLWVSGSQNPPKTRDAAFSGLELTASMKNRFLVLQYPKIVSSAGSSLWLVEKENSFHRRFLQEMAQRYEQLSGQKVSPSDLSASWPDIYAYTLDSSRTEKAILVSSLEFGDLLMGVLSGNLAQQYAAEKKIAEEWKVALGSMGSNYMLAEAIDDNKEVQLLQEVLNSFDKPLTERDNAGIKNLADLFATIKSLKKAYGSKEPLKAYQQHPAYITVEDIAAAATLLTRNKQVRQEQDPLTVVNSLLQSYVTLLEEAANALHLKEHKSFDASSPHWGLKHFVYAAACRDASSTEGIAKAMNEHGGMIKNLARGSEVRKYIVGRTIADIATMAGFLLEHKTEIDAYLPKHKDQKGDQVRSFVHELYERERGNPVFPEIYVHRLPRVM